MFRYTKSIEVNPPVKQTYEMVQTFSLLWDSIPWRNKREMLCKPVDT